MSVTFQLRGDTAAAWAAANPILAQREPALELDTGLMKVGNGVTAWAALPYWFGGMGVDPADFSALLAEVTAARGDRSSVDARIEAISRFSSPCAGTLPSGEVLDNSCGGSALTTVTSGGANAIRLVPFIAARAFTADSISTRVTTAVAGNLARHLVYESNAAGWPGNKLFESAASIDASAIGAVTTSGITLSLDADRVYWMGVWYSGTPTQTALQEYAAPNLGLIGGLSGTTYASMIQRVLDISATGAPAIWGMTMAERFVGRPIAVRLRVA